MLLRGCGLEEFVAQTFAGCKVAIPRQLRERLGIVDGDYVRLALAEILKKSESGKWVKRKVE